MEASGRVEEWENGEQMMERKNKNRGWKNKRMKRDVRVWKEKKEREQEEEEHGTRKE